MIAAAGVGVVNADDLVARLRIFAIGQDLVRQCSVASLVQLAECGMPRAGVVPRVGAFLRLAAQDFVELYFQAGIKFFEDHGQRGAHDPRTDENDIGIACGWIGCCPGISPGPLLSTCNVGVDHFCRINHAVEFLLRDET